MTAFQLLVILLLSNFEYIRDPANPLIMNAMNALMYLCMCLYCQYAEAPEAPIKASTLWGIPRLVIKGVALGLINGLVVFTIIPITEVDRGIIICVGLQVIELILQLYGLYQAPGPKLKDY